MKRIFSWFGNKKHAPDKTPKPLSVDEKIDAAITRCERDRSQALNDIDNIRKWANQAIDKVFDIPHRFWYSEIDDYEKIKELPQNQKVGFQLVTKCDKIVHGYRNQIELRRAKINLCETLIREYINSKEQYNEAREKLRQKISEEHTEQDLAEHLKRLQEMDEDTGELESTLQTTGTLESVKSDLSGIEQDVALNEEYRRQMEQLTKLYDDDRERDNSLAYKKEMDKIVEHLKKKKK